MTKEEELQELREENRTLKALVVQLEPLQERLAQQDVLIAQLQQQVQALEERLAKDSHNSHLPPSSDRFVRQPKSLRTKSGKKAGGQPGHTSTTLRCPASPHA